MQLQIHCQEFALTEALKRQAREKLDLALDRVERDVVRINMFVASVQLGNTEQGTARKRCRIVVLMRQQEPLIVEETGESVEAAIDRATDHLGVVACQRADESKIPRKPYQRYVDSDDVMEFQWTPIIR